MPIKDLYYQKYLKYKNKYLNLQSQTGGLQVYNPCHIYNITVIIVRLIILLYYYFDTERTCEYFYDIDNFDTPIFKKLEEIYKNEVNCNGEKLTRKQEDKLPEFKKANTIILFNFIYLVLKNNFSKWTCINGDIFAGCNFILQYFKENNITNKDLKNILQFESSEEFMFENSINHIIGTFKKIKNNIKPILYLYEYNYSTNEDFFEIIESTPYVGNDKYNYNAINIAENEKFKKFENTLICILNKGFYALFEIYNFVIIITGYINFPKILFNVEKTILCQQQSDDNIWCNLIDENNRVELSEILNLKLDGIENFRVLFLYPTTINSNQINYYSYSSKKIINKNLKGLFFKLKSYSKNIDIYQNFTLIDSTLDYYDVIILINILKKLNNLELLNLSNNNFTDIQVAQLLECLVNNITLIELSLNKNSIINNAFELLFNYIINPDIKLRTINLESTFKEGTFGEVERENSKIQLQKIRNEIDRLVLAFNKNQTLTEVNIQDNNLSPFEIEMLSLVLGKMNIIKLGNNILDEDGAKAIAYMLKETRTLKIIELNNTNMTSKEFNQLVKGLNLNYTLTEVNIEKNSITEIETIEQTLNNPTNIISIFNISRNSIGDTGAIKIAEILETNTTLKTLKLGGNKISVSGVKAIASALFINSTLSTLELNDNKLGNDGFKELVKALKLNTNLTEINLESTGCDYKDTELIITMIKSNKTLQTLKLGNNNFNMSNKKGGQRLAYALKNNTTLKRLDLNNNNMGDTQINTDDTQKEKVVTVCDILAFSLKENKSLTELNIQHNKLNHLRAHLLSIALKNSSINILNISNNLIGDLGAKWIADMLVDNSNLETLKLGHNEIGDEGIKALANALKHNSTLLTLELNNNNFGRFGIIALATALKLNTTLLEINLEFNSLDELSDQSFLEVLNKNENLVIKLT